MGAGSRVGVGWGARTGSVGNCSGLGHLGAARGSVNHRSISGQLVTRVMPRSVLAHWLLLVAVNF